MSDCVRVIVSIAAQLRVVRALGPAALVLVGVPVSGPTRATLPIPPAVETMTRHKALK